MSFESVLLIIMGGSMVGVLLWSATGLLGGFTMAFIVKQLFRSISKEGFRTIVIGWFIGIVGGFTVSYIALMLVAATYLSVIAVLIGGLIAGGIGGGIMYSVIDREFAG